MQVSTTIKIGKYFLPWEACSKKTVKLMTFTKKGGWGQNLMKTNLLFAHLHANFSIFPIFGQIEDNIVSNFSKLYRFYSIFVEIHHF